MKFRQLIRCVLSIPRSLYFCIRNLPVEQAIHMPILIAYDTHITRMGGY